MACGTEENAGLLSRLGLNDNKAGMQNLDREKINQIIFEASKGSKYFENEKKKDKQVDIKIGEQRERIANFSEKEIQKAEKEADVFLKKLEEKRDLSRTIVHIDMDAFYAAVETRDNPSLLNKPMAVGSTYMLSTSNYIARRFGVRAAMPGFIAKKLCPQLVIVPPNFSQYAAVSKKVKDILGKYDENFSSIGFDEAYLDITDHLKLRKTLPKEKRTVICHTCDRLDPRYCYCDPNNSDLESTEKEDLKEVEDNEIPNTNQFRFQEQEKTNLIQIESHLLAEGQSIKMCPLCKLEVPKYREEVFGVSREEAVQEIRRKIEQRTRLTASAGIAANTLLAKICSDKNKPNGQFSLPHIGEVIKDFMTDLPIRKVCGIGKVTEKMLQGIDIITCSHLSQQRALLQLLYSDTSFNHFMSVALGIGSTCVESDGERKSVSTEQTFFEISEPTQLYDKCLELSKILSSDLQEQNLMGRTVTLKIKTIDFDVKTRSQSLPRHTNDETQINNMARNLLKTEIENSMPKPLRLRLMGVRMSNLIPSSQCSKKESIEYFMKKESSTSATTLPAVRHDRMNTDECQNIMVTNQSENHETSGVERQEKSISESPGHYCPICDRKCPKNLRLFNAHIDKCLLQQSGENDRKSKRSSPIISDADFEDFSQFSTLKVPRKTKKKNKMTQKKIIFEESLAANKTPTDFCIEKSLTCKHENFPKTENVSKQIENSEKTCIKQNSSEIEHDKEDSQVLEESIDSSTILKDNLSSAGIVVGEVEDCSSHKSKDLSSPVNILSTNSEEILISDFDKPTCSSRSPPAKSTDIGKFPEPNISNMEEITSKLHSIEEEPAEVDGTGLGKISCEYVKSQHSKNSLKQTGCSNKENGSNCSSLDTDDNSVLRQIQLSRITTNNISAKPKYSQNNKSLKNSMNSNLLKYFSKSCVNSKEDGNKCFSSSVSLEWSESREMVAEQTEKLVLDETICQQQQEVDGSGQLNKGDVADQQQKNVVENGQGSSLVCDKLQKVDTSQGSSLASDKLVNEVESGQGSSTDITDEDQLDRVTSYQPHVSSNTDQTDCSVGNDLRVTTYQPHKPSNTDESDIMTSSQSHKPSNTDESDIMTSSQSHKPSNTDESDIMTSSQSHKQSNTDQTECSISSDQLDRVTTYEPHKQSNIDQIDCSIGSDQSDRVISYQSHKPSNTDQTNSSIFQLYSAENSTKNSEAAIEVDNSCNYGDDPSNVNDSSCQPQLQRSPRSLHKATEHVDIEIGFQRQAKMLTLPKDTGVPADEVSGQLPSSVDGIDGQLPHPGQSKELCPICDKDILVSDMVAFNEHVDLCLNEATIRKILLEQGKELKTSAAQKRPAENTSPDTSKRKKSMNDGSTPRIDSYFFSA